jgi:hypothetical protein
MSDSGVTGSDLRMFPGTGIGAEDMRMSCRRQRLPKPTFETPKRFATRSTGSAHTAS